MIHVVISDLHIGSPHFKKAAFMEFLQRLPDGAELILNGDTLDDPFRDLSGSDAEAVTALKAAAQRLNIIWIYGNHDQEYVPDGWDGVQFRRNYAVGRRLFITHGDFFDNVMPYHDWFIKLFKWLHNLRVKLGAPPVHVAEYAKRWKFLYRYLRRNVYKNALEYAREEGYEAVVCGHVHYPETMVESGIAYFNTGSWTESAFWYVFLDSEGPELKEFVPAGPESEEGEKPLVTDG